MSDKEIAAKFNSLTEAQKKLINREASEIKRFGVNAFWIETDLHADEPGNSWSVVKFAMEGLNLP